jgi:hypothetical protein
VHAWNWTNMSTCALGYNNNTFDVPSIFYYSLHSYCTHARAAEHWIIHNPKRTQP